MTRTLRFPERRTTPRHRRAWPEAARYGAARKGAERKGVTAVEFAIVAPVILLLFLTAIELTRLNFLRHTAANAAYEGARTAIVPGGNIGDADAAAMQLLTALQADRGAEVSAVDSEGRVAVTVTIPVNMNSWGVARFSSGFNVVQSCTLTRETTR